MSEKKGVISTRGGDKGRTSIVGGMRVDKDDIRIETLGTLDEVTSFIGLLRCKLESGHDWDERLGQIQIDLMNLMAHVATPSTVEKKPTVPLPTATILMMDEWMEAIEESLASETVSFLLPGGNEISALCHIVRTVARRAERCLVGLNKADPVDPCILQFVNRLSDLTFKLSRQEMDRKGVAEERWRLFREPRK